eukprot:m.311920 g.311920  ORF g.311920 m.311920 type:complete len:80 (+) comp174181_c0_seq1:316-555(+)
MSYEQFNLKSGNSATKKLALQYLQIDEMQQCRFLNLKPSSGPFEMGMMINNVINVFTQDRYRYAEKETTHPLVLRFALM